MSYARLENFIDGTFQKSEHSRFVPIIEPATGQIYANVPESNAADLKLAIDAAHAAQPSFAGLAPAQRARLLHQLADAIEADCDNLAAIESKDCGKTITQARQIEIPRAAANFRYFAAMAESFGSESHMHPDALNVTLRAPLGTVACISPWNLPLYLLTWKIAPALACGNAVIAKPSEVTPATAHRFAELAQLILPPGVLNILHGSGAGIGQALVRHPEIKAVSFTGSTQTGAAIASECAPSFKKVSLELGGKNPMLIFADADFDMAVQTALRAAFSNQGQICLCASRILIERSIYRRFVDAFVMGAQAIKIGDPSLLETQFGALVSSAHLKKVQDAIALAEQEGGRKLLGGARVQLTGRCAEGYFLEPTIFDQLPQSAQTNQQEIFGPVVTLQPFDNEAQALLMANDTRYGLATSVYTQDVGRAQRLAHGLQMGMVWINCWMHRDLRTPFGGVKASGLGREGGVDAMRFFTDCKNVAFGS